MSSKEFDEAYDRHKKEQDEYFKTYGEGLLILLILAMQNTLRTEFGVETR